MNVNPLKWFSREDTAAEGLRVLPLESSCLCLDCETICSSHGPDGCPVCGSKAIYSLAKWLNRKPPGDRRFL